MSKLRYLDLLVREVEALGKVLITTLHFESSRRHFICPIKIVQLEESSKITVFKDLDLVSLNSHSLQRCTLPLKVKAIDLCVMNDMLITLISILSFIRFCWKNDSLVEFSGVGHSFGG